MGKNNVNPDHYKVAGRERQGEDILQERHKQTHAESLVADRTGPPGQVADAAAEVSPGKAGKPAVKKATPKKRAAQGEP